MTDSNTDRRDDLYKKLVVLVWSQFTTLDRRSQDTLFWVYCVVLFVCCVCVHVCVGMSLERKHTEHLVKIW